MKQAVKVDYKFITRPGTVVLTSSLSMLLVSAIVYFSPENQGWWNSPDFSWSNMLQFVLVDQILIECCSVYITFWLLIKYTRIFRLVSIRYSLRDIIKYELAFLPLVLGAFFVFNPITQTIRFFYHVFILSYHDWNLYWKEYFYSGKLYLIYLPLVFIQVYGILNFALIRNYASYIKENKTGPVDKVFIKVASENGNTLINQADIVYCEKVERSY